MERDRYIVQKDGRERNGKNKGSEEKEKGLVQEKWRRSCNIRAATPQSQLQRKCIHEIKDQGFRIKVVEKSGTTLKQMLQRSDPLRPNRCTRTN